MLRLERVVEHNDRSVAYIATHIVEDLLPIEVATVVACDNIPHYGCIFLFDSRKLAGTHKAVRGAKEWALYQIVSLLDVAQVVLRIHMQPLNVAHRVVAHLVTGSTQRIEQPGVARHIVAGTEERCRHIILLEYIQYPRGNLGYRAIIEGKIYALFAMRYAPQSLREIHTIQEWWA